MIGLLVAVRYLTIVPFPGRVGAEATRLGAAAPWFPVIGLGIGLIAVVVGRAAGALFPPLVAALLTVTVWKLLTGGLHLDGLADCLDGLPGPNAAHRLAVMRDSRIGAFGAIGLILFLFLEIVAVAELPPATRWPTLLAAPAMARAMPVLLARVFPAANPGGQGAKFRSGLRRTATPIALAVAAVVALGLLGWIGLVAFAAALVASLGVGWFWARRLCGITGDVLGASVELAELTILLMVIAWGRARL